MTLVMSLLLTDNDMVVSTWKKMGAQGWAVGKRKEGIRMVVKEGAEEPEQSCRILDSV